MDEETGETKCMLLLLMDKKKNYFLHQVQVCLPYGR